MGRRACEDPTKINRHQWLMDTHDNPQDPGMVYLPTFAVCFNGISVGNYTSPLDASWDLAIMSWFILKQDTFF